MYRTLGILRNYEEKNHEGVNYPCNRCDYKATSKSNLIRHTQTIHDDKWYPSDKCKKYYNYISVLIYHKKIIHDGSGNTVICVANNMTQNQQNDAKI